MKKLIYFLSFLTLSFDLFAQCDLGKIVYTSSFNLCDDNPWVLVFEDNFDGNSLDLSIWNPATGVNRDINFEKQKVWLKPDNVIVENGILKIISKRENLYNMPVVTSWDPYTVKYENFEFTSGEICTKYTFGYGKFEARIKIPKGKGFWPAFWTFGGNPAYNEIDIFEFWDNNTKNHNMTTYFDHDGNGTPDRCLANYEGVDFSLEYHIFSLVWAPNYIYWYVDGDLKRILYKYYTIDMHPYVGCQIGALDKYLYTLAFPRDPMAIILNIAIQTGNYKPDNSTPFPSQMEVDWVRYYQRKPCQDINITDASQFTFNNQVYNIIAGDEITINCNFTVQSGQQLKIVAKNFIILEAGFTAEAGSVICAEIDPNICGSTLKSAFINNIHDTLYSAENLDGQFKINKIALKSDIQIYPNPNGGNFIIDFGTNNYQNFSVRITNTTGQIIYSIDDLSEAIVTITLNDYPRAHIFYI